MPTNIAVIIPVYNRPKLVQRAIRTAQAQTYAISEIIVIDDASSDDTADAVRALAKSDPRVRLIQQPQNRGANAARNVGWKAAKSEWIALLDSDDKWEPAKMERQVQNLCDEDVASFTGYWVEDGNWSYVPPVGMKLIDLQKGNALGPTSTALVKRSAIEGVGGFDENLPSCQDWDMWIKLFKLGPVSVVQEPLVRYEQTGRDRIGKDLLAVVRGHNKFFARIMEDASKLDFVSRRRVHAMHKARLASAILGDFRRPLHSLYYCIWSILIWPNRYALSLIRRGIILALSDRARRAH